MSITRRNFLRDTAVVSSALALAPRATISQAAQVDAHIDIFPSEPIATIQPEIYGHFIEHLVFKGPRKFKEGEIASSHTRQRIEVIVHLGARDIDTVSYREDDL